MSGSSSALLQAVEASRAAMLEFTKQLAAIPTENPPGNEYERCAEAIFEKLRQLSLAPRMVETVSATGASGLCILAGYGEGDRALHFHGHYDVVPGSAAGQFEPHVDGPNLFGRGTSDMKSGLAAMIYAAHALGGGGAKFDGRIELAIVPDEETGGARGAAALSGRPDFARNSIGMLLPEPTSGVVWNANRGAITMRVTVKGKSAHVGLSCQGVNAFEGMLAVARELGGLKQEVERRQTSYRISPAAARRSILMMGGECGGGSNFNLVPASAWFTVDRRTNPEENLAAEKQRLFELFDRVRSGGVDVDVDIFQEGAASGTPEDHPLALALGASIEEISGKAPRFELCPGLLESRFYAERGVAALAYGPGILAVSHGPNEFVPIKNIGDCAAVYALTAARMLAPPA